MSAYLKASPHLEGPSTARHGAGEAPTWPLAHRHVGIIEIFEIVSVASLPEELLQVIGSRLFGARVLVDRMRDIDTRH